MRKVLLDIIGICDNCTNVIDTFPIGSLEGKGGPRDLLYA